MRSSHAFCVREAQLPRGQADRAEKVVSTPCGHFVPFYGAPFNGALYMMVRSIKNCAPFNGALYSVFFGAREQKSSSHAFCVREAQLPRGPQAHRAEKVVSTPYGHFVPFYGAPFNGALYTMVHYI